MRGYIVERIKVIELPVIEACDVRDELCEGKNGIRFVDSSFCDRFKACRIPAQSGKSIALDELRKEGRGRQIVETYGGMKRVGIKLGDLLATIRSNELTKGIRYICFIHRWVVRMDCTERGIALHAFSIDAPGRWREGRQIIVLE